MSGGFAEFALLEDVCSLPAQMQKIYLQLVSAIDLSLQNLRSTGASPELISGEFIEEMVNELLDNELSDQDLQEKVRNEFLRQILESSELESNCS
ncbi:MAG: hypothetical protein GKR91_18790 [Pseudomonadales bacterium]|nr:hypothetical protein [Pseudomonadales bacterium]